MGATISSLKGFFMPIYSQKSLDAYKQKRKRDAAKAKKKLEKLLGSSEVVQQMINKKAASMAYAMNKKRIEKVKKALELAPAYSPGMGALFYKTREWREVRYKVFVRFGKKCQCCGSTDGYLHVDHILPRSKYPDKELDIENLQILCEACNIGKSNKDTTDWR